MSTLRGAPLILARLDVPPSGGWLARVTLASGPVPELGAAELRIADLSLLGTITIAGEDEPDQPVATIAGGAGWDVPLARLGAYGAPGGVRLSTVLRDLCGLAGEPYDAPAEALLPDLYEWPKGSERGGGVPGRIVLRDLVVRGAIQTWRIDPSSGHTRFDPWPDLGPADGLARLLAPRNTARGTRTLGLDRAVAGLLPGSTIEGKLTRRLTVLDSAGKLKAIVREQ